MVVDDRLVERRQLQLLVSTTAPCSTGSLGEQRPHLVVVTCAGTIVQAVFETEKRVRLGAGQSRSSPSDTRRYANDTCSCYPALLVLLL